MPLPPATLASIVDVGAPFAVPELVTIDALDDAALLEAQRQVAEVQRRASAVAAVLAARVAYRSRPELGYDGLAQRLGARTPQQLVQRVTGATRREAGTLVSVGRVMVDGSGAGSVSGSGQAAGEAPQGASLGAAEPWLSAVGAACAEGTLSLEAAAAIRAGLGTPSESASEEALSAAAARLVREAPGLSVERLAARSREVRDDLDCDGVAAREAELRARRYLHLVPQVDGMTRLSGLLDPESAALVRSAWDSATAPRRVPTFRDAGSDRARGATDGEVDSIDAADARYTSGAVGADDEVDAAADDRTPEQRAVDAFVELVRLGASVDGGRVLGGRGAPVQLLVTDADLAQRRGAGRIEGADAAVSIATVERAICSGGYVPIHFDSGGQVVNVGRDHRLFTRRQRVGLAARDGGCRFPECSRPPSWCEAHHIDEWQRDGGRTDIADGVLLCRHHHLLVHNTGWRVVRAGAEYSVVPPATVDPLRRPIAAPSASAIARRLRRVA